jgi:hypothetical protein
MVSPPLAFDSADINSDAVETLIVDEDELAIAVICDTNASQTAAHMSAPHVKALTGFAKLVLLAHIGIGFSLLA